MIYNPGIVDDFDTLRSGGVSISRTYWARWLSAVACEDLCLTHYDRFVARFSEHELTTLFADSQEAVAQATLHLEGGTCWPNSFAIGRRSASGILPCLGFPSKRARGIAHTRACVSL